MKKTIKQLSKTALFTLGGGCLVFGSAQAADEPLKVGNTEVKVSGYIKADAIRSDVDSSLGGRAPVGNQVVIGAFIPLEGSEGADQNDVSLHARQSRLNVDTKTGDLKTRIQGDFFGADGNERFSNSNNFRIRIAWAEFGRIGFGQNWSAAAIFPGFAEVVNFSGYVGGYAPIRQTSIRYTAGNLVLALENPETTVSSTEPGPSSLLQGTDDFPDLIARYNVKGRLGAIQGVTVVRGLSDSTGDLSDTGIGVILGGSLKLGGKDDLKFIAGRGALGRFLGDGLYADAEIVNGDLEALDITSASVAYRHFWSKGVRSSLIYGASEADNGNSVAGSNVNKEATTVAANLLWDVTPKTTVGFEISNTEREVESGATGELNRVQFSLQQKF